MKKYKVVVMQQNVFYIDEDEAETAEEARRIAVEDRIWGEQGGEDTYNYEIFVEEEKHVPYDVAVQMIDGDE